MEKFQLDLMQGQNISCSERLRISRGRIHDLEIHMAAAIAHNRLKTDSYNEALLHCQNFNEAFYVGLVMGGFDLATSSIGERIKQMVENPYSHVNNPN